MAKKLISGILLGSAVVGTIAFLSKNKAKDYATKRKQHEVKNFLRDKFPENDNLLEIVDHLSEEDLDYASDAIDKLKAESQKIVVDKKPIKESLQELKTKITDLVAE